MQENETDKIEMTDEELVEAIKKIDQLTQLQSNKMTFDDVAFENDREDYLALISRRRGPSPSLSKLPCKRVALTKGLGYDGRIQSIQIVNPAKQALKEDRRIRKANRKKGK